MAKQAVKIAKPNVDRGQSEAHLRTPHFLKYKDGTAGMVRSLRLTDVDPVMMRAKAG